MPYYAQAAQDALKVLDLDGALALGERGLGCGEGEARWLLDEVVVVAEGLRGLTYTNVLTLLDLGGVPLRARDRGESDPLV